MIKSEFLKKQISKGRSERQAKQSLAQAANNVNRAEELIDLGLVDKVESMIFFVKKSARINIVLQFFAKPEFEEIRADLKGKKAKAGKFVEWVIIRNEENRPLSNMIARYKDYAVTFLSG